MLGVSFVLLASCESRQLQQVTCEPGDASLVLVAQAVPTATLLPCIADEAGTRRFEEPISLPPRFVANRYYVFEGGCVTYRFAFNVDASPTLSFDVDEALSFRPRAALVEEMREQVGLELCGAGASPCPG